MTLPTDSDKIRLWGRAQCAMLDAWGEVSTETDRELAEGTLDYAKLNELETRAVELQDVAQQVYRLVWAEPQPEKYEIAIALLASCSQNSTPATVDDNGHCSGSISEG